MSDITAKVEEIERLVEAYKSAKDTYEAWIDDDANERKYHAAREDAADVLLGHCLDYRDSLAISDLIDDWKKLNAASDTATLKVNTNGVRDLALRLGCADRNYLYDVASELDHTRTERNLIKIELAALKAERDVMAEALAPFADWASTIDDRNPDDAFEFDAEFSVGDFRKAAKAISAVPTVRSTSPLREPKTHLDSAISGLSMLEIAINSDDPKAELALRCRDLIVELQQAALESSK